MASYRADEFAADDGGSIEGVLDQIGKDRAAAAGNLLGQLESGVAPEQFTDATHVIMSRLSPYRLGDPNDR